VPIGELFTILGHNGAGKSTMINILTGNISPSFGTAEINNTDIILDQNAFEQLIGLCPQHDILWEELTAEEHIIMYAKLRGINIFLYYIIILNLKHKKIKT
jgi:ABC-type multidrug transport system ATPase subunit